MAVNLKQGTTDRWRQVKTLLPFILGSEFRQGMYGYHPQTGAKLELFNLLAHALRAEPRGSHA